MEEGLPSYKYLEPDFYGESIHNRALEIADFEFFWKVTDENAPFGSDEGYEAFAYFYSWRENRITEPIINSFNELFRSYSHFYHRTMENWFYKPYKEVVVERLKNSQLSEILFEIDVIIIAIGFSQLIREGLMDVNYKPYMRISLERVYKRIEILPLSPEYDKDVGEMELFKLKQLVETA